MRKRTHLSQHLFLVRMILTMVATALLIAGCNLPVTHVHPYFGPTYGDGGGGG
ncbi:MAG TPA: hypothetical protein VH855_27225 [Acetobacteraceae bacterium]